MRIGAGITLSIMICVSLHALPAFAGDDRRCKTRYPVVLSYAWTGSPNHSFGRIPEVLEEEGADVYMPLKHACQSTMFRADELRRGILYILAVTGKDKVNIIGHCQGSLDSRYMIANLGMAERVASWTGITGGHQGLITFDILSAVLPKSGISCYGNRTICHDDTWPDNIAAFVCLGTDFMRTIFNPMTPNQSGVYYQTWTARMSPSLRKIIHVPSWLAVKFIEGDNDGYVSSCTGRWGNYRGSVSALNGGVSHYDIIDNPPGLYIPGFDVYEFYVGMVDELKNKGY